MLHAVRLLRVTDSTKIWRKFRVSGQELSDFIWAVRQINYCLAAIGASPSRQEERDLVAWTHALTLVLNPALRSFSVGVRSYYFTVAAAFWFLGPLPFLAATTACVSLLIWRQSWSDTAKGVAAIRQLLEDDGTRK
jgi:uncharacterized membrane protein